MVWKTNSWGRRFFYVSGAVVVAAALMTVITLSALIGLNHNQIRISATDMDHAIHEMASELGSLWGAPEKWPEKFEGMRNKRGWKPVRFTVINVTGQIRYSDSDLIEELFPQNQKALTQSQLIGLLAGKQHMDNDRIYVVAPITWDKEAAGIIVADLKFYTKYRNGAPLVNSYLFFFIPILATVIASLLASLYLGRNLRLRLGRLVEAIQNMGDGGDHSRLPEAGEDEISQVAVAFNRMADKLDEARRQEELLEQLKRDLITGVSHDLRNPLSSVQGYLEAIEDGVAKDPETVKKYVAIIKKKTGRLAELVEDLLTYSRLQGGKFPLDVREVEASDWLREALAEAETDLDAAGIELVAEIPEKCGRIRVDEKKMNQVVANLVSNTIRYAPAGTQFKVELSPTPERAIITFSDEGPGMDNADLPFIFERFYRGRGQADGVGTGLGLAIAAQIVRAHGGEIQAKNLDGQGASFQVILPLIKDIHPHQSVNL